MKYLNLSKDFNPFNAEPQDIIEFEKFIFSGGEPHIKIKNFNQDEIDDSESVMITHRINSFNDLGLLAIAVDVLKQSGALDALHLFIPYFPGARQDRRTSTEEPLTIKVYANIINDLGFDDVIILDPHSDVTSALIENVTVITNHDFVEQAIEDIEDNIGAVSYIVSPDAGANKKIKDLAKYLEVLGIVKCDKTRDVATGNITGFEVYKDNLNGQDCIIVDDICDGGGTFIGLAKELKAKGAGKLHLIVTHGIFSKGFRPLEEYFDSIYSTDSIRPIESKKFKQIKIELECIGKQLEI